MTDSPTTQWSTDSSNHSHSAVIWAVCQILTYTSPKVFKKLLEAHDAYGLQGIPVMIDGSVFYDDLLLRFVLIHCHSPSVSPVLIHCIAGKWKMEANGWVIITMWIVTRCVACPASCKLHTFQLKVLGCQVRGFSKDSSAIHLQHGKG